MKGQETVLDCSIQWLCIIQHPILYFSPTNIVDLIILPLSLYTVYTTHTH